MLRTGPDKNKLSDSTPTALENALPEALRGLSPKLTRTLFFLSELSRFPVGSGNEEPLRAYLRDLADGLQWRHAQDNFGNLVVKTPGQGTGIDAKPVIFQGHLDIIRCPKNHDFETHPIKLIRDYREIPPGSGNQVEVIRGDSTSATLDNHAGIALILGLASDPNIDRPPFEIICSSQEEVGLIGAMNFDPSLVTSTLIINLDNELDGTRKTSDFMVSCAGGRQLLATLSDLERIQAPLGFVPLEICVKNYPGGHSGLMIDENRGNAIRILGEILKPSDLSGFPVCLESINGGEAHNQIPASASAIVWVSPHDKEAYIGQLQRLFRPYAKLTAGIETGAPEPCLLINELDTQRSSMVMAPDAFVSIVGGICQIHNGPYSWSRTVSGLVETSSNLAMVLTEGDKVTLHLSGRSSKTLGVEEMQSAMERTLKNFFGFTCRYLEGYPAWDYDPESSLLKLALEVQTGLHNSNPDLFPKPPTFGGIHAGLETGIFIDKISAKLDVSDPQHERVEGISCGFLLVGAHSANEALGVKSYEAGWEFLCALLARLSERKAEPI